MKENISLNEKFLGCIAGCHIGSAMGAAVEGWSYKKIEETYGTLDKLLPYEHYHNGWVREPGTTEDGVERQKLIITSIIEKKDRVNAEDVRNIWIRDIKPESIGMVSEPFEATLLAMAKSGIPARDIGKYCDYSGLVSFARSCHPIGLINAGDVDNAINDIYEVGQLYQMSNSRGLKWAAITGIAIATATKADATIDSVLGAIYDYGDKEVVKEIDNGLNITRKCKDFRELRKAFDDVYSGVGIPYMFSYANEIVTKAISIFKMVNGNPKDAVIASVNMGRDTDCTAAIAAGISGSLSGAKYLPDEWLNQVDYAASINIYTNSRRTLFETADGLYNAYRERLQKMNNYITMMMEA
jgi:ADP-ribosylglycohydrolase